MHELFSKLEDGCMSACFHMVLQKHRATEWQWAWAKRRCKFLGNLIGFLRGTLPFSAGI